MAAFTVARAQQERGADLQALSAYEVAQDWAKRTDSLSILASVYNNVGNLHCHRGELRLAQRLLDVEPTAAAAVVEVRPVVVAKVDLSVSTELTPDKLETRDWPVEFLPDGVFHQAEGLTSPRQAESSPCWAFGDWVPQGAGPPTTLRARDGSGGVRGGGSFCQEGRREGVVAYLDPEAVLAVAPEARGCPESRDEPT